MTRVHNYAFRADEPGLALETRTDAAGNKVLTFDFMSVSDIHLGTRHSRAKRTSHMFEHTHSRVLHLGGDEIDGIYLRNKKTWNFAPWHRQVIAHILRRKMQDTHVVKLNDNHAADTRGKRLIRDGREVWHRKLSGKEIYGTQVREEAFYQDAKGRLFRWLHGDVPFDDAVFGKHKGFWYSTGDTLHTAIVNVDTAVQTLPKFDGFSFAAASKKLTKTVINRFMGVDREITSTVDGDPSIDGIGYGHSHMGGIKKTPAGKLILNSGCCTEHVQALVCDRYGNFGFITWHKDRLDIVEENGRERTIYWKDIGLDNFLKEPGLIEDEHTARADRIIRLIYRMWPPKDRQKTLKKMPQEAPPLPLPASLRHPHRGEQERRRMLERMSKPRAAGLVAV